MMDRDELFLESYLIIVNIFVDKDYARKLGIIERIIETNLTYHTLQYLTLINFEN